MPFCIGDEVREGTRVGTVTDVGTLLIQIKTTLGMSRVVCPWEVVKVRPAQRARIRQPVTVNTRQTVTPMQRIQDADLAWALIDIAKPHMTAGERHYAFVTVGAGDMFAAIRHLVKLVAAKHIPLRPHLVHLCTAWADSYARHEEYESLCRLIDGVLMADTIQASTTISRLPSAPKPRRLLTVPTGGRPDGFLPSIQQSAPFDSDESGRRRLRISGQWLEV
jgi:hypothetical protein